MNKSLTRLYWRVVLRVIIVSSVVVPLGGLYVWALVNLDSAQIKVLVATLLWLPAFLLGINALVLRLTLTPLLKVIGKFNTGVDVSDAERLRAERCVLTFPYLNVLFATWWFSFGGAILAWLMIRRSGLGYEEGLYIVVSAVTVGIVAGLGVFYTVRKPLKEALILIFERCGVAYGRPPFFVPISVKLTGSFLLIIGLILAFLSFLSFVSFREAANKGVQEIQKKKLRTLAPALVQKAKGDRDALVSLIKMASRSESSYCLVNKDFTVDICPSVAPSPEILKELSSLPAGEGIIDRKNRWSWMWMNISIGEQRILSGWELMDPAFLRAGLQTYYIKIVLVTLLAGMGLGILVALDISRPLRDLSRIAIKITEGNFETEITPGGEDEIGILARAITQMTEILLSQLKGELERSRLMLGSIQNAVHTLAPMSKELVAIAGQQASGSIEQASAAEEAATTSQEIVAVSKQIAQNASEVADIADNLLKLTKQGQERLDLTLSKFGDINEKTNNIAGAVLKLGEQSQEIGDITKIIDEISEQTNLLALNAAIEAVGAGEHGQRFGVVAQEIRRLAQNTAQSTRKIQEVIDRMQNSVSSSVMYVEEGEKSVDAGRSVINEMAKLFGEIFDASNNATPRLKEIGLMTSQQSTASEQMAKTIAEVRETAMQNSAAAEQLQSSIKEIESIAAQLEIHAKKKNAHEESSD